MHDLSLTCARVRVAVRKARSVLVATGLPPRLILSSRQLHSFERTHRTTAPTMCRGRAVSLLRRAWPQQRLLQQRLQRRAASVFASNADQPPGASKFFTRLTAGEHVFVADEPASVKGTDLGPNPYDLLLGSLGACTVMTLRMYADRKKLNLDSVSVDLSHNKVHANECADCGDMDPKRKNKMVDRIERNISIRGDLTDKERQRLLQIADMCPVHRTLEASSVVVTSLVE